MKRNSTTITRSSHRAGFTLIELLLSCAVFGILMSGFAMAMHASLHAYSQSVTTVQQQRDGRAVTQRLLAMIRSGMYHDAFDPDDTQLTLLPPEDGAHPMRSVGMTMLRMDEREVRIWWAVNPDYGAADMGDVWFEDVAMTESGDLETPVQCLLERVRVPTTADEQPYLFTLSARRVDGMLMLEAATIDFTLWPNANQRTTAERIDDTERGWRHMGTATVRKTRYRGS